MKKPIQSLLAATGLIGAALLSACGGGDDSPPPDKVVAITFAAVNGSTPVACGTQLAGMGSTGVAADLKDLRFYITNLKLINDKGEAVAVKLDANSWQLTQGAETVSLVDLENATGACKNPVSATCRMIHMPTRYAPTTLNTWRLRSSTSNDWARLAQGTAPGTRRPRPGAVDSAAVTGSKWAISA